MNRTIVAGAVVAALGGCEDRSRSSPRAAAPTANLEVVLAEPESEYMSRLGKIVSEDPVAIQLGIEADFDRFMALGTSPAYSDLYLHGRDRRVIEDYLAALAIREPDAVLPRDRRLAFERDLHEWRTYFVEVTPRLTAADFAGVTRPSTLEVVLAFDGHGARALAATTTAAVGKKLVVVVDGEILAAFVIAGPITDGRLALRMRPRAAEALAAALSR